MLMSVTVPLKTLDLPSAVGDMAVYVCVSVNLSAGE